MRRTKIKGLECAVLIVAKRNSAAVDLSRDVIGVGEPTDESGTKSCAVGTKTWVVRTLTGSP